MKNLYVATKNKHKIKEIQDILKDANVEVMPFPNLEDIEETGLSFEENACIKSLHLSKLTHDFVIADDSGLEVAALNNAPGIYSARYAGTHGDDKANNAKLLKDMAKITDRRCRFVCVIALAKDGAIIETFRGEVIGKLGTNEEGGNGFGYDPIFITESGKTMANLTDKEKNNISHRKHALENLKHFFSNLS